MHRMFEFASVDSKTRCRAIRIRRQSWICVARETVSIFELLRRDCDRGPGQKRQNEQTSRRPAEYSHTSSKCPTERSCRDWCHKGASEWFSSAAIRKEPFNVPARCKLLTHQGQPANRRLHPNSGVPNVGAGCLYECMRVAGGSKPGEQLRCFAVSNGNILGRI